MSLLGKLKHALALDHSPSLSALWQCPCKLCALANPDRLTPADREAKTRKRGMCGLWVTRGQYCMRANGHEGRCLP